MLSNVALSVVPVSELSFTVKLEALLPAHVFPCLRIILLPYGLQDSLC